ncbi:MAG: GntR family transcriptional regulator [Erysipelotrichaceae bacterium]
MNKFDSNIPIYLQIIDIFKANILNGEYQPGSKIPSVRELGVKFGVNPNTVQRALVELERSKLLRTENRTAGRYISDDQGLIASLKKNEVKSKVKHLLKELKDAGFKNDEILELMKDEMKSS